MTKSGTVKVKSSYVEIKFIEPNIAYIIGFVKFEIIYYLSLCAFGPLTSLATITWSIIVLIITESSR